MDTKEPAFVDPAPEIRPIKQSLSPLAKWAFALSALYLAVSAVPLIGFVTDHISLIGMYKAEGLILFGYVAIVTIRIGCLMDKKNDLRLKALATGPILNRRELASYEGRGFSVVSEKHKILECNGKKLHVDREFFAFVNEKPWDTGEWPYYLDLTEFALWLDKRAHGRKVREEFLKDAGAA